MHYNSKKKNPHHFYKNLIKNKHHVTKIRINKQNRLNTNSSNTLFFFLFFSSDPSLPPLTLRPVNGYWLSIYPACHHSGLVTICIAFPRTPHPIPLPLAPCTLCTASPYPANPLTQLLATTRSSSSRVFPSLTRLPCLYHHLRL